MPDLVLTTEYSVTMLELMIPTNSHEAMRKAREGKSTQSNYMSLISDLEERGLKVGYQTLEIGSPGHHLMEAVHCISNIFQLPKSEAKNILLKASKVALARSYHIFNLRNSASWDPNKPSYVLSH